MAGLRELVDEVRGPAPGPQGELGRRLGLGPRLHPPRWSAAVQPSQLPGTGVHRDEGCEPEAADGTVSVSPQHQGLPASLSRLLWDQENGTIRTSPSL